MSTPSPLQRVGLPRVAQIGYVVRDLDAAIALYDPLFGPFQRMDGSVQAARYRGRRADCRLELAFGWSGDLEIEHSHVGRCCREDQRPLRRRTASASSTCFAAWSCELKTWRTMPSRSIT